MKSILLLTDFSDNSFLAAEYACLLSRAWQSNRILLFHAYAGKPVTGNEIGEIAGLSDRYAEALDTLEVWRESLKQWVTPTTTIDILVDEVDLPRDINLICEEEAIDIIVLGITGRTGLQKVLIGSNAVRVMEKCNYPLLIVPANTTMQLPEAVAFATDLKAVKEKIETIQLDSILAGLNARLDVVNIADKESDISALKTEIANLHQALDKYQPSFFYVNHADPAEGINIFALDHDIRLIITQHKKQTGLSAIFRQSVSKKLAWHSQIPVLVLPMNNP